MTVPQRGLSPEQHRLERFLALEFSERQAKILAASRDDNGVPIWWADVKDVLDAGCDHQTAFDIFRETGVLGE